MRSDPDFVISNGVLIEYKGPGGDVVIPEGITEIGDYAFYHCRGLTSVVIPASVTEIGWSTFRGCKELTSVPIPESVTAIGYSAFSSCTSLQQIDLPRSIRKIGVDWCGEKLYPIMPEGLALTRDKLNQGIATQIDHIWYKQMTVKDWAGLYLFQTAKVFQNLCKKHMKAPWDPYFSAMLELLERYKKAYAYVRAVEYASDHVRELSPESIQKLYELVVAKKNKKALELLELLLKDTKTDGKALAANDPYAFLRETFNEAMVLKDFRKWNGEDKDIEGVKLKGSNQKAPSFVTLCAIAPYAIQYQRPTHISGYQWDYITVEPVKQADQAAALLDHESLMNALKKCISKSAAWYVPYCRYAGGVEIMKLIVQLRDWTDWYSAGPTGRSNLITVRGALMLSGTREAMWWLDKDGNLDAYAQLRDTDAETLRETVLAEFDLDE